MHAEAACYAGPTGLGDADGCSDLLNQTTYNVGRKISRMVATGRPPMMANAVGPQNTVGAIGIIPSTVETAVKTLSAAIVYRSLARAHAIAVLASRSLYGNDAGHEAVQTDAGRDEDGAEHNCFDGRKGGLFLLKPRHNKQRRYGPI
jgi:hypothetical protein